MTRSAWGRALVVAAVFAACFWRLGSTPLNETDEGFAANRSASFFRHHSLILTYDDVDSDQPQFHKPPLWYWIVAACYRLIGFNEWAFRLPTAMVSFLLIILMYRISRRVFDEAIALSGAALLCTVPFALLHMRTAMLEMPVLFLSLIAMWVFGHDPKRTRAALLAGLLCGLLFLIKGPPGFVSLALVIAYGLALRPLNRALLSEAALAFLIALVPPAFYFLAVPADCRGTAFRAFFVREVAGRLASDGYATRMAITARELLDNLRWHAVAAAFGLLFCLVRVRERAVREWLALAAIVCLPVYFVATHEVVPYARYLLPIFPFAVMLSTYFAFESTRGGWRSWTLLPFAVSGLLIESSPVRWIALVVPLVVFSLLRVGSPRKFMAILMLAFIVSTSIASSRVTKFIAHELRYNQPDIAPLAREAGQMMPPGEKVISGGGFKCHGLIFYSGRAVESFDQWLLNGLQPSQIRHGIFRRKGSPPVYPGMEFEILRSTNRWQLCRIKTAADLGDVRAIAIARDNSNALRQSLDLLGVGYRIFKRGVVITNVAPWNAIDVDLPGVVTNLVAGSAPRPPTGPSSPYPPLAPGDALVLALPAPCRVAGVGILPLSRLEHTSGLAIDILDAELQQWRTVAELQTEADPGWFIEGGRLRNGPDRAVRVRFAPANVSQIRLRRLAEPVFHLARLEIFADPLP